ncbi:PucR family transcriptional regulator [Streptomyces sp. NPDC002519]
MPTIEDLVRGLGDSARLVVAPPVADSPVTDAVPWEPGRIFPAGTVLLGVGVPAPPLLQRGCAGVVVRDPADEATRAAWADAARRCGAALILLHESAAWPPAIQACARLLAPVGDPSVPPDPDATGQVPVGDLFALADAFADMVGGPTIIEDANFRVLAYSSFTGEVDPARNAAILGRRMPPEWLSHLENTGDLERLRTGTDVVDLASGPWQRRRRLITAVRASGQLLGILGAAEGDRPLRANTAEALRRAADIAVPHLLRHQEGHRAERIRRGALVRELLEGRGLLHRHAAELGFMQEATLGVLAFAPQSHEVLPDEVWDRITDHVALSCEAFRWHVAAARIGSMVFAILALPGEHDPESALRLGREIVRRSVPVLRDSLCGAISTTGPELSRLSGRRQEAEDAVGIVRSGHGADRFVAYEAVRPRVILHELRQTLAQRAELRLPGLRRLAEEDERRHSEFTATLSAYLDCGGQAGPTARRLGVHVTTLRYRLGRIKEISGLDIDDPAVRLVCQLLLGVAGTAAG